MKYSPSRVGHLSIGLLVGALLEGPQTVYDLVEATGLCDVTIRHYVKAWRKQKLLRVAEWHLDGRNRFTLAAYTFGKVKDAARPKPRRDNATRMRAYRTRQLMNTPLHLLAA